MALCVLEPQMGEGMAIRRERTPRWESGSECIIAWPHHRLGIVLWEEF